MAKNGIGLGVGYTSFFTLRGEKFLHGDGLVADRLAEYCNYSWDKEDSTIENYPEVMKDLCT